MTEYSQRRREFILPDIDSTFRVFAAHWRTVDYDWKYPLHKHPLFEVNLVLSGMQEMSVGGKAYVLKPGDLILLNAGASHESRVIGDEEMTYYCLHFDVDERSFRELLLRNQECFHTDGSLMANAIRPALDKLIALTSEEAAVRIEARMSILSALFELFAGISGVLSKQQSDAPIMPSSDTAWQIASLLERSVEARETEREGGETITAAAAAVGYSPSTVNRIFLRAFGVSPRQYLSTLLLKKAKLLLMDPELSIEEISSRLGYTSIAHFSRQFKRWSGESPSSFRGRFQE